jgi:hypothetical protein
LSGSATVIDSDLAADPAGNRAAVRRGWILWLAAVVPAAAGLALIAGSLDAPLPQSFGFRGFPALFALAFGSVGTFVVTRRPGNRVGGILIAIGINSGVLGFIFEYANVGLVAAPGSLPGALWAAWLASWTYVPIVILAGPLLLSVYPDGRFLSNRWRAVAGIGVGLGLVTMLGLALGEGPFENFTFANNPIGILPRSVGNPIAGLSSFGVGLTFVACAASLILRFRAADRVARQQLKWFAMAALFVAVAVPLPFLGRAGSVIFIASLCALPVATGMAVLRYGLYEIDTVINRALVYGLLTALLAGLFTASIGLMQRVSKAFTGADSEAALVLTTLVVVAAFTPVKSRLQTLVDRRFKENRDPAVRLTSFVKEVQASLSVPDTERTLRRFLHLVVEACDLRGAHIELDRPGSIAWNAAEGEPPETNAVVIGPAPMGGGSVRLTVGQGKRRPTLTSRDRSAVEAALVAVAAELD